MAAPRPQPDQPPTIVLYDGHCRVCNASVDRLNRLDKGRGRIDTRDLNTSADLVQRHRLDPEAVRGSLHVITPDGRVHTAMDAVRASMTAVGRGWMVAWTRLPGIRQITNRLYRWFARNRSWLSPRRHTCTDASCRIDS